MLLLHQGKRWTIFFISNMHLLLFYDHSFLHCPTLRLHSGGNQKTLVLNLRRSITFLMPKRKELAKAQTAFLFLQHLQTIDTRLPDSMTVLEIYNILCFTNSNFYSRIASILIIELPNRVEDKLWVLAVSYNLNSNKKSNRSGLNVKYPFLQQRNLVRNTKRDQTSLRRRYDWSNLKV